MKRIIFCTVLFVSCIACLRELKSLRHSGMGKPEEALRTDEPGSFLKFHAGIRTRAGDEAPRYAGGAKWHELRKAKARAMGANARSKANGILAFKERGPGNVPGRTRAVLCVPGDPSKQTWLAGAATGGIWRSSDGGANWADKSTDFPALPISSFATDASGSVIYAGTGEAVSSFYSAVGDGIFKSTDKGVTWMQLASTKGNEEFSIVTRLIVDPFNPALLVATTVPGTMSRNSTSHIMRSSDGGISWQKVHEGSANFEQIIATPGNFNIQYATQNGVGIWKSIDAGQHWSLSSHGLDPFGRIELSVSNVNPNILFAAAEASLSETDSDLYFSQDAGATWALTEVMFDDETIDFFGGQGFYDNTVLCDPFDSRSVYFGGVSLFKATLATTSSGAVTNYLAKETNTNSFLSLQPFAGIKYSGGRLDIGDGVTTHTIEIRFGPGSTQRAHRFLVPENRTNNIAATEYTYQNYVDVPFEVWDITANRQLMVSFRDQNRNGQFDLVNEYLTNNGLDYLLNSREYIYVHNYPYTSQSNSSIAKTGGHLSNMMYNIFPALAEGATWQPANLPDSKIILSHASLPKFQAVTTIVADGRGEFDKKNTANQIELSMGVHPDHHCMTAIIDNEATKTFRLLLGNDGGIFVSKSSKTPGILEGDWQFKGFGYNTGQFYGADKCPGRSQYIGGLQDNGTRISPASEIAAGNSRYAYALGGDGFEVLWHSSDPSKLLATSYYGQISKSTDGGKAWKWVANGENDDFPFVTKLANSKDFPDRVFTVGQKGVYVSQNFGESWTLTPITSKFIVGSSFFLDVEVSRANANIVWAGSGMNNAGILRNLHVSTDGGKTFKATNNFTDVALGSLTKLATHPTEPRTAYALFSFADAPKVLRTRDLGETWHDISGYGTGSASANGFPDVAVYALYVRPDNPNIIWVGSEIGIVESVDGGVSWKLLTDFPSVAVWDMKGQDNEIVIATHGRGIWTATTATSQNNPKLPRLAASGTSPLGRLAARIELRSPADSVVLFVNGVRKTKVFAPDNTTLDLEVTEITGTKSVVAISYKDGAPMQSNTLPCLHQGTLSEKNSYATYFASADDFWVDGFVINSFPGTTATTGKALQTSHPYANSKNHQLFLRTPIRVSDVHPKVYLRHIAIIEPDKDSVVVEATRNGLDWITLAQFDAQSNVVWQSAFSGSGSATQAMYVQDEVDLTPHFNAGELVLFRIRAGSNAAVNAWGYALDRLMIQQTPTSIGEVHDFFTTQIFPNPATEIIQVSYDLQQASRVVFDVVNLSGQQMHVLDKGVVSMGKHLQSFDVRGFNSGTYLLRMNCDGRRQVQKFVVTR